MLFPCLLGCAVPTPNNKSNNFFSFFLCNCKNMFYFCIVKTTRSLSYGVIGNTTDSGPVIHGSSPCIPTQLRLRIFIWSLNCFLFLMHDFPWIQTHVQCLFGYSPKVYPRGPPHRTRGVRHRGPLGYGMFAVCKFLRFLFVVGVIAASFCLPGFPCLRCYVFLRKSCLVDEKTLFLQHISDLVPNGCISLLFRT